MRLFDKKVLLVFTLVFSGWMQTTIVDAKEITMAKCPDPFTISEGKLEAKYAVKCAEAALGMLKVVPLSVKDAMKAAELTFKSSIFFHHADKSDVPDADVDKAEGKSREALAEMLNKAWKFRSNCDMLRRLDKTFEFRLWSLTSELDVALSSKDLETCDIDGRKGPQRTNRRVCKCVDEEYICPRRHVRKSPIMRKECKSLDNGFFICSSMGQCGR